MQNVIGGKSKKKYSMTVGDTGRSFVDPEGQTLSEAQMKAAEGDWMTDPGNTMKATTSGGALSGGTTFEPDMLNKPKSAPTASPLGSQERGYPSPAPQGTQGASVPTPVKTSMFTPTASDVGAHLANQYGQQQPQTPQFTPEMLQQLVASLQQPQPPPPPPQGQGGLSPLMVAILQHYMQQQGQG